MTNHPGDRPNRLHYAWIVAGLTFLVLLATAGVRSAPAVLIVPLEREFGWSRATISAAISVNLVLYGLIGPFAAALMEVLKAEMSRCQNPEGHPRQTRNRGLGLFFPWTWRGGAG